MLLSHVRVSATRCFGGMAPQPCRAHERAQLLVLPQVSRLLPLFGCTRYCRPRHPKRWVRPTCNTMRCVILLCCGRRPMSLPAAPERPHVRSSASSLSAPSLRLCANTLRGRAACTSRRGRPTGVSSYEVAAVMVERRLSVLAGVTRLAVVGEEGARIGQAGDGLIDRRLSKVISASAADPQGAASTRPGRFSRHSDPVGWARVAMASTYCGGAASMSPVAIAAGAQGLGSEACVAVCALLLSLRTTYPRGYAR